MPVKRTRRHPSKLAWLANAFAKENTCNHCGRSKLLSPKDHIGDQIATLKDESASKRQEALKTLGYKCINWLEDKDVQYVSSAIENDQDDACRACAAIVLGKVCAIDAGVAVTQVLTNDPAWQVLENAAWAAGEIYRGCSQAYDVTPLLKTLRHERPEVRMASAQALGKVGNSDAFAALADVVSNKNEDLNVRSSAIDALGRFGRRAINPLFVELNDEANTQNIRTSVAFVLGEIGDKKAVERLYDAWGLWSALIQNYNLLLEKLWRRFSCTVLQLVLKHIDIQRSTKALDISALTLFISLCELVATGTSWFG